MNLYAEGRVYATLAQLLSLEGTCRQLRLTPERSLDSLLAGRRGSPQRGRGADFETLRRYQAGDDLRHLDWRASQRLGRPFVRTWREERDRPVQLLVDQRMDMYFGSQGSFKSTSAVELAALCAWMACHDDDRIGGQVFGDTQRVCLAPQRGRRAVHALLALLLRYNHRLSATAPFTDDAQRQLDRVLQQYLGTADQTFILISDFAGATSATGQLLRQLAQRNTLIALQVHDPMALSLPRQGRALITQGTLQIAIDATRASVHRTLADFAGARMQGVAQLLRDSGMRVVHLDCAQPLLAQLLRQQPQR